jgi:hypothetical protein
MPEAMRFARFAFWIALGVGLAALSGSPQYRQLGTEDAVLRVSIVHASGTLVACREVPPEELTARAPNMRAPLACPRERAPLRLRVVLDGAPLLDEVIAPRGLAHDGRAILYRRYRVGAGTHRLEVLAEEQGAARPARYHRSGSVSLTAGKVLTIDLRPERGGILFL